MTTPAHNKQQALIPIQKGSGSLTLEQQVGVFYVLVKQYKKEHPGISHAQIARHFGVPTPVIRDLLRGVYAVS